MEINEIAEGLDRDTHPRDGFFVIEGLTEKLLKGLIGTLAELSQKLSKTPGSLVENGQRQPSDLISKSLNASRRSFLSP